MKKKSKRRGSSSIRKAAPPKGPDQPEPFPEEPEPLPISSRAPGMSLSGGIPVCVYCKMSLFSRPGASDLPPSVYRVIYNPSVVAGVQPSPVNRFALAPSSLLRIILRQLFGR
jgi:hypothetical protein